MRYMSDAQKVKRITPREAKERWQFGRFLPRDVKRLRRFQKRLWRLEKDNY
jgi:hypothetical protein